MLSISFYSGGWLRVFSVAVVVFFSVHSASGQAVDFCGVLPLNEAESTNPDSVFFDRFGNSYDLGSFQTPLYRSAFTEAGYFNLNYDANITTDMKKVIDRVFLDLSGIIIQRINETSCGETIYPKKVSLQIYELTGGDPGTLAAASATYGPDFQGALCNHIAPNYTQSRINGGKKTTDTDGLLGIRMNLPFGREWNVDYPSATTSGYYDLYSVVLHEALHILGFASNLGLDAQSFYDQTLPYAPNNIYSLWDDLLHTTPEYEPGGMSLGVSKVLESDCLDHCKALNSVIFPTGAAFNTAVESNCDGGGLDFMIGENGIAPVLGGGSMSDVSVVNSLSHLNVDCNGHGEDYVMQPTLGHGVDRREITAAEMEILCELGYAVSGCNKCYITSINTPTDLDYYGSAIRGNNEYNCCPRNYFVCVGEELIIPFEDLLCDKFTNSLNVEITDAYNTIVNPSNPAEFIKGEEVVISGETIIITPLSAGDQGRIFVNFEVETCDCTIERFVLIVRTGECVSCEEGDICENLVCTEGFEEFDSVNSNDISYFEQLGGGYHIYEGNNSNFFYFCNYNDGVGDNTYVRFTNSGSTFTPSKNGLSFKLTNPIQPGCTAKVKFKASTIQGTTHFEFLGSEAPPCYFLDSRVKHGCQPTDCGDYIYNPVCMENMPVVRTSPPYATGSCSGTPGFTEYDFDWENEEDFPVHYIMVSVNPSNPIQYHVYFDDLEVLNECPVDACFDYETDCLTVSFESCYEEGYEHEWIFDDGNTSSEANPVHTYVAAGTYYVQHHILNECDNSTDSDTLVVVVEECAACECIGMGSININAGAGTLLSSLTIPPHGVTGRCLSISGKLIVDIPYNIYSSEIKMSPGAEIVIEDGGNLFLLGVNEEGGIHGCDKMWKGITVEENGRLTMANSVIQDAHHAVRLHDESYHHITTTLFNKNHIGVYVPALPTVNPMIHIHQPFPFRGNTFDCEGEGCELLPPYDGQPALLNMNKPYAGIVINNTTFVVGSLLNGSQHPNYFYEVANGIVSSHSALSSYRSDFETMYPLVDFTQTNHRSVVSNHSRVIIERNRMRLRRSAFESRMDYGTRFSNSVTNNCYEGLLYDNTGLFKYDLINGNQLDVRWRGMHIRHQKNRLDIRDNTVKKNTGMTVSGGAGIQVVSPAPYAVITGNELNLNNNFPGLQLGQVAHATVEANELTNSLDMGVFNFSAVTFSGGRNNIVSNNVIDGSGTSNRQSSGFSLSGSPGNLLCCNDVGSTGSGIHFYGMNDNTILKTNELTGYKEYGLHIAPSSFIGEQAHRGNTWSTASTTSLKADAAHRGTVDEIFMSRFEVEDCMSALWPAEIIPEQDDCATLPGNWFTETAGSFDACGVINDCPPGNVFTYTFEEDLISLNDLDYLDGALDGSYYANMLKWEKGKQLYRRIYKDTALINYNTAVTDFYTAAASTSMGRLVELEEGMDSLRHIPPLVRDTLEGIEAAMDYGLNAIRQTDSLLVLAATSVDSTDLSEDRMAAVSGINALLGELSGIRERLQAERENVIDSLQALNEAIVTTHVIDFMEKYVNRVYLETVARDSLLFTPAQEVNLYNIARECPMEFGNVVYRARGLYSLIREAEFDDSGCVTEGEELPLKRAAEVEEKGERGGFAARLMPNPTRGQLEIEWLYREGGDELLVFEVMNLQGRVVRTEKVWGRAGRLQVDLTDQAAGMYIVRVHEGGKLLDVKKVLILR